MTPQDSGLTCTGKTQHAHSGSPQARVILVGIGYVLLVAHIRAYIRTLYSLRGDTVSDYITIFHRSGATCSGKTTLAKHLHNILPGSFIIHQDVTVVPIFYLYLLQTQNSG
jgi:hypothetical protein